MPPIASRGSFAGARGGATNARRRHRRPSSRGSADGCPCSTASGPSAAVTGSPVNADSSVASPADSSTRASPATTSSADDEHVTDDDLARWHTHQLGVPPAHTPPGRSSSAMRRSPCRERVSDTVLHERDERNYHEEAAKSSRPCVFMTSDHHHRGHHGTFGNDRFGVLAERLGRAFGTPQFIIGQTVVHPGGLRRTADPARPDPSGGGRQAPRQRRPRPPGRSGATPGGLRDSAGPDAGR
jgi:hypothetical protein